MSPPISKDQIYSYHSVKRLEKQMNQIIKLRECEKAGKIKRKSTKRRHTTVATINREYRNLIMVQKDTPFTMLFLKNSYSKISSKN